MNWRVASASTQSSFGRRNVVRAGEVIVSAGERVDHDVDTSCSGLDQCLELVREAMQHRQTTDRDAPPGWLTGEGVALTMIHTTPPKGHRSTSQISLRSDGGYALVFGTAEFGNSTSTVHCQMAAAALNTTIDRISYKQSDTAHGGHDTGAFGSTGTVVAGAATERAARALRDMIVQFVAKHFGGADWKLERDAVTYGSRKLTLAEVSAAALSSSVELTAEGQSAGSPRSLAFNVQGFRIAVSPRTGEIRILKSVQAADAGTVINPMQCRGQIEGGVAQAIGATLYEELVVDANGRVINPSFRDYHVPAFADVPFTEVYFADTRDVIGPFGAKSMSESPYNPVAAALGNALRDATGVRFCSTPFRADRVFLKLAKRLDNKLANTGQPTVARLA
jgi:putative selenate reductase molybdopterin-binding subunit